MAEDNFSWSKRHNIIAYIVRFIKKKKKKTKQDIKTINIHELRFNMINTVGIPSTIINLTKNACSRYTFNITCLLGEY
jgi:hypothetical protein